MAPPLKYALDFEHPIELKKPGTRGDVLVKLFEGIPNAKLWFVLHLKSAKKNSFWQLRLIYTFFLLYL